MQHRRGAASLHPEPSFAVETDVREAADRLLNGIGEGLGKRFEGVAVKADDAGWRRTVERAVGGEGDTVDRCLRQPVVDRPPLDREPAGAIERGGSPGRRGRHEGGRGHDDGTQHCGQPGTASC